VPQVPFERHALDNGLRIVLSHDPRAPAVAVNLWYDVGSKHEKAGGTLNATTWLDRTNYFETLPGHELELALWLEADRMASLLPAMTQEKLDNQRDVVKNERRYAVDNQPYGDWDERMQALVYPASHPYHHPTIGSMEDLSAASLDDVQEFFATYYAPNNAVLTIAGDFETDAALAMIERHFGRIAPNSALPPPPSVEIAPILGEPVRITVPDQVPLPRIYQAYRVAPFGTDAFDTLDVTADILGSGRASRLYAALVREQRVAQDVSVFVFPIVGGAAMFALWVTARPGVAVDTLEAALHAELDRLATDGPSDADLERVRNLQSSRTASALERISERADRLGQYTCLFDEPERINTEVSRYAAVDAARIMEAMRASIIEDNRVTLTYVPAEGAS
jgi:zinc protease